GVREHAARPATRSLVAQRPQRAAPQHADEPDPAGAVRGGEDQRAGDGGAKQTEAPAERREEQPAEDDFLEERRGDDRADDRERGVAAAAPDEILVEPFRPVTRQAHAGGDNARQPIAREPDADEHRDDHDETPARAAIARAPERS